MLIVLYLTIQKGQKFIQSDLSILLNLNCSWDINEQACVFFYDKIYGNEKYLVKGENWDEVHPEKIFLAYVSNENPDKIFLSYMLSKIDLSKADVLCEKMYPYNILCDKERINLDMIVPSFQSEKILFPIMPIMSKYSGHHLLHAAIINADIQLVMKLVNDNKALLVVKTNPIHEYIHQFYGSEPYTPLELAKEKYIQCLISYKKSTVDVLMINYHYYRMIIIEKIIRVLESVDTLSCPVFIDKTCK